jgi:hypothetical protein
MDVMLDRVIMMRLVRGRAPGLEFDIVFCQARSEPDFRGSVGSSGNCSFASLVAYEQGDERDFFSNRDESCWSS